MKRRGFLQLVTCHGAALAAACLSGCRGKQYAHVLDDDDKNMVGSHTAGAEVFDQQIEEAVGKLLGQQMSGIRQVSHETAVLEPKRICFVGIENASAEELADSKQQIFELIDQKIIESKMFETISQRYVESGLKDARLRPDDLFKPSNRRLFADVMERNGTPFDYLLWAKFTSLTTKSNGDSQRDYLMTLELVDIQTGKNEKVSAKVRKGYHKSVLGRIKHYSGD